MTTQATDESAFAPQDDDGVGARTDEQAVATIGVRLLDDAYRAWLIAECDSTEALGSWLEPDARGRRTAYGSYLAAVDREEAAARDLRRLCEIAAPCLELLSRTRSASPDPREGRGPLGDIIASGEVIDG
jgi:hypothetical protein